MDHNAFDKTAIVLIIVSMVVTAVGSVVRDRVMVEIKEIHAT